MVEEVQVVMFSEECSLAIVQEDITPKYTYAQKAQALPSIRLPKYIHTKSPTLSYHSIYLSVLLAHFAEPFGACFNSNEVSFEFAFSKSKLVIRGVGGTSSIRVRPREVLPPSLTFFGNSDRRGVKAVATRLADFRMLALTSQDRFFAR